MMLNTNPAPEVGVIVVGIDDAPSARAALTWAAEFARSAGDRLRVIHVFSPTDGAPVVWTNGFPPMPYRGHTSARVDSAEHLEKAFQAIGPEPGWTLEFREGAVGSELVRSSADARLLVVGTREHTGVERVVAGSVSHFCLNHASCPVAAVAPSMESHPRRAESSVTARHAVGAP
jgi:nucleotide-binding universal stress UspA family protein